jgi:hypothetical protein
MHPRGKRCRFGLRSRIEKTSKSELRQRTNTGIKHGYGCRQNGAPIGRKGFNVMTIYYYVWFGVLIVLLVLNVVAVVAGRNSA